MSEDDLRYPGWRVAAAAGAGVCLASIVVFAFPVLLRPLAEEFGWSRETISAAYGVAAVMSALSAAPLGYALDRAGARRVILPCLLLFGAGFASLGLLTPSRWHLFAAFALIGLVVTGTSPVAYARVIATWFDRRRGLALALTISGASLGGVLHPPLVHALMSWGGWRLACAVLGVLVLAVGCALVVPVVRAGPAAPSASAGSDAGPPAPSARASLRSWIFWTLMLVQFCASTMQNGATVHLVALLTDRGVTPGDAALVLSVMGAANAAGRLLTGWLIDRLHAARVSCALLAIAAAGAYLLGQAQTATTGALAAALIGFGIGGESDITPYLLSRYFGLRALSTLFGVAWMASASAGAIGPILMGRAFDATGSYENLLIVLSSVTLSAGLLMLALPGYVTPAAGVHSSPYRRIRT